MRKIKITIWVVLIIAISINAQIKNKYNPFQMVSAPDSVIIQLGNFLVDQKYTAEIHGGIYIYNLIEKKRYKYTEGVFIFRLMSPHASPNIFINCNNHIKILKSNCLEQLIEEYLSFLKTNEIPLKQKLQYLQVITKFYEKKAMTY